eukprot:scaffold150917_cov17-Prasinocladus_malaysianus.AAC.1
MTVYCWLSPPDSLIDPAALPETQLQSRSSCGRSCWCHCWKDGLHHFDAIDAAAESPAYQ